MFVDASAITAMLARKPEGRSFADRLEVENVRLTSVPAIWEAARGLQSARALDFPEARARVSMLVREARLTIVPIGEAELELALDAHQRFGKGIHRAKLNFGDCLAYACAKSRNVPMLFEGEDFVHTDVRDAMLV